jgi:hypothetical protein
VRYKNLLVLRMEVDEALLLETDAIARRILKRTRTRLKVLMRVWSPPPQ